MKTSPRTAESAFIRLVASGLTFTEIAKTLRVTPGAVTRRVQRLPPKVLCGLIANRNQNIAKVTEAKSVPIDLGEELIAIRASLVDTRRRIDETKQSKITPGVRFKLELMTADRQIRWIDALLKTNAEMMKVAGFLVWQEELLATLHEADPALREKFLARVRARGALAAMTSVPATAKAAAARVVDVAAAG